MLDGIYKRYNHKHKVRRCLVPALLRTHKITPPRSATLDTGHWSLLFFVPLPQFPFESLEPRQFLRHRT
jgi:hypothetical protein